ncbi:MAG: FAD:protein FMN transferase [Anaeromyxobacteraceae bacterium]
MLAPTLLALAAAAAVTAPPAEDAAIDARSRDMMTTRVTIAIAGAPDDVRERAFAEAFAAFERVEVAMNEWRPGTPLALVNAAAGSRRGVAAPADLCDALGSGLEGARRTGGLFDPTWAAVRDLWKFDASHRGTVPPRAALARACALVSWRDVQLLPRGDACTVRLPRKGMRLGLGGLAKGWGVDRAVARLRALGLADFFVQAGGDLYAAGRRSGRPWRVGIRDPRGEADDVLGLVEVSDAAFSTSGDYERWFEVDGVRYHHLLDPRTCEPARASEQVTILAPTAVAAEVLTKAAFIRGGEAAVALAEREGATAVVVDAAGRIHASRALADRIGWTERAPPSRR